jgi:hypothetical protein
MGNWYFIVGLMFAGATGYILDKTLPEEFQVLTVVCSWGMIALWGVVLGLALLALPVVIGVYVGKLLFTTWKELT